MNSKSSSLFLFCSLISSLAFGQATLEAGAGPIADPRLPQSGGSAAPCLKGLIQPRLQPGQQIWHLSGPFSPEGSTGPRTDRSVVEYDLLTRLPFAEYRIRFKTTDAQGWQYYSYMDGSVQKIGNYASQLERSATVLKRSSQSQPYNPDMPADLTPCEQALQVGD